MVSRISRTIFFVLACLLFAIPGATPNYARKLSTTAVLPKQPVSTAQPRAVKDYGRLPLLFEANRGQTDARVQFVSRGPGYTLFLTSHQAVLTLAKPVAKPNSPDRLLKMPEVGRQRTTRSAVVRLQLEGANSRVVGTPEEEVAAKSNYFIGNNPSKWHSNVPNYKKVRYRNIYPGIDLVYYGNHQQLEHDFVVAPGANPGAITLAVQGAQELHLDREGNLVVKTKGGELRLLKPKVFQTFDGARHTVSGHYRLKGKNKVGFEIAEYDRQQPLVIDPVLLYSTYLGGSGAEVSVTPAVDTNGNVYVTGWTSSVDFPTKNAAQSTEGVPNDAFVSKLSPDGSTLLYSTYLGGDWDDMGFGITTDESGQVYITGWTESSNFPVKDALQTNIRGARNAFISKLGVDGSLLYSTYLGGSDDDVCVGIAVDAGGNMYVTGRASSSDFPTKNAFQPSYGGGSYDAFVTKLAADGSAILYSTYLGGSGLDHAWRIAVDSADEAYVVGYTSSGDFPTSSALQSSHGGGSYDAFVTKLAADGSALVYSTYLGGSGDDYGFGIAIDANRDIYVTGVTGSSDFPVKNGLQSFGGIDDAYVTKISADGSALLYSTYLGGSAVDYGYDIAIGKTGEAYATGFTLSADFPTKDALEGYGGTSDAYVTKISADGSALLYSTYIGGSGNDWGFGIAVDTNGNAYITGGTGSGDFPVSADAFQKAYGGGSGVTANDVAGLVYGDAFITKIGEGSATPVLSATPATLTFTATEGGSNPSPQAVTIGNTGSGTLDWTAAVTSSWLFLDSNSGTAPSTVHASVDISGLAPGTYHDTITVTSKGATNSPATIAVTLTVASSSALSVGTASLNFTATIGAGNPDSQAISITNTGTGTMDWTASKTQSWLSLSSTSGTAPSTIQVSVNIASLDAGTYQDTITITASGAANSPQTIPVTLTVKPAPDFQVGVGSGGSSSESVTDGSSATYDMDVTPLNGFTGPVSFTCSKLPSLASCSFSHEPLSVSGPNPVPFTVMIETTATTTSGMTTGFGTDNGGGMATGLLILAGISLLMAVMLKRRSLALATLLLGTVMLAGCGGGSSAPASVTRPGTPTGTYTVVLTATSGNITHQANLTLTVK